MHADHTAASPPHAAFNRSPLSPNPLAKLPLGAVRPLGWLKHQLALMVEGMTGRLDEISEFLADDNGWFGTDKEGWEEQPYWFRGLHDLAALTGDERLARISSRWVEAVLAGQDGDGYFGARAHKRVVGANGQQIADLWPHMVMLDAMMSHYEHTSDERVLPFMTRFFAFCRDLPREHFMPRAGGADFESYRQGFGNWKVGVQMSRAGDMLSPIYWLYNRTGEEWLLRLATRFFEHILPPAGGWLDEHVVHFAQRFAYAGIYHQQSHADWHRAQPEYWYRQHMAMWGQQPRGIFGADELIRPGKVDPRQGFETCAMVEIAKSFYALGRITGDPLYADRCEDVMLNHFPAAQTPDLTGLHYLTAANMPQLDAANCHDFQNEESARADGRENPQLAYSPHLYRCCQHNVAMGWPWYAQNLWQATSDGGIAAWLYAPCEVTTRVGPDWTEVTVAETTEYPFDGAVALEVRAERDVSFPLHLRVPGWCQGMRVCVNGRSVKAEPQPSGLVRIERSWNSGDRVEIEMPMSISVTRWPRTGAATVDRGPLSYSVRIDEEWRKCGGTEEWPEHEVFPASAWNYGLVLDEADPAAGIEVAERRRVADQPWTLRDAPVELAVEAARIPAWRLGEDRTVPELQQSPVRTDRPAKSIRMVPLGCARLRMSCLPVIGDGADAREWR